MNKKIHNRISITTSTPGGTYNDAVTSTESQRLQDGEPTREIAQPTYASRFWFFNYLKMCSFRLTNDLYISFMTYWYPDREILPAHIVNLMQVQSRLRAERESHAVTLSRYKLFNHPSVTSTNERSTQTISLVPENKGRKLRQFH